MTNWVKYLIIIAVFIFGAVSITFIGTRHNSNVTATQEVEVALESSQIGQMRESATIAIDKQAIVANLLMEVAKTHKGKEDELKIDYVFLDGSGNQTNNDENIESIQYRVQLLGSNNEVLSTSTQRIGLNKLMNE